MSPYPRDVERTMRSFYRSLHENDRRRYAAVEAAKLGHGGIEYISQVLGVDPKTIRQGQRDLEDLPDGPAPRVREPGGGRKRKIDEDPKIDEDFRKVLVEHTAGSPTEESLIWTNLTKTEIVDLMQDCGSYVSVHIVDQLLDRHDYHERKALRMEPLSRHPDRDAQFETIARLKRRVPRFPQPDPQHRPEIAASCSAISSAAARSARGRRSGCSTTTSPSSPKGWCCPTGSTT